MLSGKSLRLKRVKLDGERRGENRALKTRLDVAFKKLGILRNVIAGNF